MSEPPAEQPQVTATVSPADPPRSRWGAIPHHLGRARTSTVVLSLLFLGIGTLWLNIRPDPEPTVPTSGTSGVEQPVVPDPVVPTTSEPTPEPVPTTSDAPTTVPEAPTTSSPDVPAPTETGTGFPTTPSPEPPAPLPEPTGTPVG